MWTLCQYGAAYDDIYKECDTKLKAIIDVRLDRLRLMGNEVREPVSKYLENGIFELRARSKKVQVRFLYFFCPNKVIIIAVGLFKKQSKVPRAHIERAKQIKVTYETEQELLDGTTKIH